MHRNLKLIGWTKARELVKVARRDGQNFESAPWVHKASAMPREEFKREVERHLTGERNGSLGIALFQGVQKPIGGNRAGTRNSFADVRWIEIARLLSRNDLRRFRGGRESRGPKPRHIIELDSALLRVSSCPRKTRTPREHAAMRVTSLRQRRPRIKLCPRYYRLLCRRALERDSWRCQQCGRATQLEVHHIQFRSALGDDDLDNLITLCANCHRMLHIRGKEPHTAESRAPQKRRSKTKSAMQ